MKESVSISERNSGRKRVLSGIQPTGDKHIGNYLGAIREWVAQQDQYEAFYCIVDLHAMTVPWDPDALMDHTRRTAATLLASGIDPQRATLFIQSHVPAHSELAWVLTCIAKMGELRRMVQFKEKSSLLGAESVGAGLFTYPVLQAADILVYRAHGVPVGEDQRQHIELARDLADRFNFQFGYTLVPPEAWIPPVGARIMALDDPTQKMSTSASRAGSKILMIDPPDVIAKKVGSAVTDSGREIKSGPDKPAITNLLTIFALMEGCSVEELEGRFEGAGYKDFKQAVAESLIEGMRPFRERYEHLMSDAAELDRLLATGARRANEAAEATMAEVRDRVGLRPRPQLG